LLAACESLPRFGCDARAAVFGYFLDLFTLFDLRRGVVALFGLRRGLFF